jgi:hypothetical protein
MAAQTQSLVPFAHVADVERSIEFYAYVGFRVKNAVVPDGQTAPIWAWLESEKANLMVGLASGPVDSGQQAILFYLYYDGVKQTHASLAALGHAPGGIKYPFYMPGGEFRLEDPDGYVLMLAQIQGRLASGGVRHRDKGCRGRPESEVKMDYSPHPASAVRVPRCARPRNDDWCWLRRFAGADPHPPFGHPLPEGEGKALDPGLRRDDDLRECAVAVFVFLAGATGARVVAADLGA